MALYHLADRIAIYCNSPTVTSMSWYVSYHQIIANAQQFSSRYYLNYNTFFPQECPCIEQCFKCLGLSELILPDWMAGTQPPTLTLTLWVWREVSVTHTINKSQAPVNGAEQYSSFIIIWAPTAHFVSWSRSSLWSSGQLHEHWCHFHSSALTFSRRWCGSLPVPLIEFTLFFSIWRFVSDI